MIFAVVITDETVFGAYLDVPVISVSVNEHRADWRFVGIADRQAFESITAHQFVAGFSRVGGFGIGTDHARGKQRVFHIMPALLLRISVRAFLRERRRTRESWI